MTHREQDVLRSAAGGIKMFSKRIRRQPRITIDFGREIRLFLVYILLAHIGFGVFMLIFNLYVYALDFREDTIGLFSAVQTFTMAVTALMMGTLVRRVGLWTVIVGGISVYALSNIGLALSTWVSTLLLFSATSGAGLAIIFTATMPFIIEHGRVEDRTNIATVSFSLASLSMTMGSLIGGFAPIALSAVIPTIDAGSPGAYRAALLAGSLLGLAAIVPLLRMSDARRPHRIDRQIASRESSNALADPRRTRMDVGVFVVVGLITAAGAGLVIPFYNVYLQTLGATTREIGLVYAAGGIAAAIIGLSAPMVSRRFGSVTAILMIRGASIPLYLLLIVAPWYGLAVIAHIVRQISINMAWPVDSTFISELLSGNIRASVFGWRSATWNLGIGLSSFAGGWMIVRIGYDATFAGFVGFTAAAVALYYLYYKRHPKVVAGEIPSAISSKDRAKRAILQTEAAVGTIDGDLPGITDAAKSGDVTVGSVGGTPDVGTERS